jgi:phytoene/squalene synthetase
VRQQVEDIYALVRVADELVDSGHDPLEAARSLNSLEAETELAIETGFSANLVVHAFALTARETGFGRELTAPFFESMRMDLTETSHNAESFARYVYGSAEVVGLMCLRAFLHNEHVDDVPGLETGARALGAAFQKVNFLRDLAADFDTLGRSYFPNLQVDALTESDKLRLLDDIDADLALSAVALRRLPNSSRRAVALAQFLFAELSRRLRATPVATLRTTRVRVSNPVKARLALAAATGRLPA